MINIFNLLPIWQLDGWRAWNALNRAQRGGTTAVLWALALCIGEGLFFILAVAASLRALAGKPPEQGDRSATWTYTGIAVALAAVIYLAGMGGGGLHGMPAVSDRTHCEHHGASMRATATLDKDVERLLRKAMHSRGKPLKQVLNDAIRAGLGTQPMVRKRAAPFVVKARPMGLRSWVTPTSLNKAADELEIEGLLARRK